MDPVKRQYEAYPYPERDPADETRRLIVGSPSAPVEIDHFCFRGRRDWSRPFRALVAGGGTGDGLIQLAQGLADARCPADIVYLDLSQASRRIAEARAAARGLTSIRFLTGDLAEAPALAASDGPFDYIDCCGVLHHLPDPQAGFDALAAALAEDGGMGVMVYAPLGRTGVYPLQETFRTLFADDDPATQVRLARKALGKLPPTNWFVKNPHLGDHDRSDAGLFDLLLHGRDQPFTIERLSGALDAAGLGLISVLEPMRYDPLRHLPDEPAFRDRVAALSPLQRLGLGERLAGNIRLHVVYAAKAARVGEAMARMGPEEVPHLNGVAPAALANEAAKKGRLRMSFSDLRHDIPLPRAAAPMLAALDGRRPLGAVARGLGLDWFAFAQGFAPVERALRGANLLRFSRGLR